MKRLDANPCDATAYPIRKDTKPWVRENTVRNSLEALYRRTAGKGSWRDQTAQQDHDGNGSSGKHWHGPPKR
jgi:hypothetical protein